MSRINDILQQVTTIQRTISLPLTPSQTWPTQIVEAYPHMEWDGTALNCPFFVNNVGSATSDLQAAGAAQGRNPIVKMYLCLQPWESGASLAGNTEWAYQWIDAVYAAFALHVRLGDQIPTVLDAYLSAYERIRVDYGGTEFSGVVFDLTVHELYPIAVGA